MRLSLIFFLLLTLFAPSVSQADLLKLSEGRGLVIMGYDNEGFSQNQQAARMSKIYDGQASRAANFVYGNSGGVRFLLSIAKFDPETKQLGSLFNRYSLLHSELLYPKTYFMYASVPEGDYVIYKYIFDMRWGSCLNKQTAYFHVAAGSYNYVGKYSPFQNQLQIYKAIDSGLVPDRLINGAEANIRDETLVGFTPNTEGLETKAVIEAELIELSPVLTGPEFKLQTPDIISTEWDIDKDKPQGKGKCTW